ncbi:hypothetical protein F4809DRAFT_625018 [Biscogniauxia mediterranea]|nr:hypothetical protein F4809DRAFT_625018 [Biscogniauxia mediterranea]
MVSSSESDSLESVFTRTDSEEEDELGFDEHLDGRVYQFTPLKASKKNGKFSAGINTETSSTNTEDSSTASFSSKPKHIFHSQYTGDAIPDGAHTAKLTVIDDPKKQRQSLFRWM